MKSLLRTSLIALLLAGACAGVAATQKMSHLPQSPTPTLPPAVR